MLSLMNFETKSRVTFDTGDQAVPDTLRLQCDGPSKHTGFSVTSGLKSGSKCPYSSCPGILRIVRK